MAHQTLVQLFDDTRRNRAREDFLCWKDAGSWKQIGTEEAWERARSIARACIESGVKSGDRVGIVSNNRPEWTLCDFGIQMAGGVPVPIYPTLTGEQMAFIIRDAEIGLCIVETEELGRTLDAARPEAPCLHTLVMIEGPIPGDHVHVFDQWTAAAPESHDPEVDRRIEIKEPDDLATLIYTSGTTGDPKGVMLSHRNLCSNAAAVCEYIPINDGDKALSFLPLSHVFERMVHIALIQQGAGIAYAENFESVGVNMREVAPTFLAAVPRFYEKFRETVMDKVAAASGFRRAIFNFGINTGKATSRQRMHQKPVGGWSGFKTWLAHRLVYRKLKDALGGRIRILISGGAPLDPEVARWFHALHLTVLEGYGLTETSPVITVNQPEEVKFGTVGKPIPGIRVKIAEDGEILVKGPNVMQGYFNRKKDTEAVFSGDWFHTGDIGEFDNEGYLCITDRKKNLIKTAGGKYVAPQPIEDQLRLERIIANAVVIGDRRKYCVALIELDRVGWKDWAAAHGKNPELPTDLNASPEITGAIETVIERVNANLASFETVKYFRILPGALTIEGKELTPTLKVRRKVVETRYADLIDEMYT
jgi:long-chain acyl-CoA synthetase